MRERSDLTVRPHGSRSPELFVQHGMSVGIHLGDTIANRNDGAISAIAHIFSLSSTKIYHYLEIGPHDLGRFTAGVVNLEPKVRLIGINPMLVFTVGIIPALVPIAAPSGRQAASNAMRNHLKGGQLRYRELLIGGRFDDLEESRGD